MSDSRLEQRHEGGGQHGGGIHVRHEGRAEHGADLHERDVRRELERKMEEDGAKAHSGLRKANSLSGAAPSTISDEPPFASSLRPTDPSCQLISGDLQGRRLEGRGHPGTDRHARGQLQGHQAAMETAPREFATNPRSMYGVPCASVLTSTLAKTRWEIRTTVAVPGALSPRSEFDHAPLPRRAVLCVDAVALHAHPEVRGQPATDPCELGQHPARGPSARNVDYFSDFGWDESPTMTPTKAPDMFAHGRGSVTCRLLLGSRLELCRRTRSQLRTALTATRTLVGTRSFLFRLMNVQGL